MENGDGEGGGGSGGDDNDKDKDNGGEGGGNDDSLEKLQEQLKAAQEENSRLTAKVNAANKHQKESERAQREAERKQAEADGNYEQLFNSSEKERQELQEQLDTLSSNITSEKVSNEAMKIAMAMEPVSEGAAEDLASHIAKRLKYIDGAFKVTNEEGELTVSTRDQLKEDMQGSTRYAHLIKGNQSSGGGANGGSNGGSASKTMTRANFDALNAAQKVEFSKKGGTVID